MAKTNAQKRRAERQDSLREFLSKKCTIQQVINTIEKIEDLDESKDTFSNSISKFKVANEQRIRLLNKYLPDLKATEFTGDSGGSLTIQVLKFADSDSE